MPFFIALTLCAGLSLAEDESARRLSPSQAVRVLDPALHDVLDAPSRISITLVAILDELERSDLIVHVVTASTFSPTWTSGGSPGVMHFVAATGGRRFVRIAVDDSLGRDTLVALLAHELYHALEVSRDHRVVDAESLRRLYMAIGERTCGPSRECYDTAGAREAGYRVLRELRGTITGARPTY